MLVNDCSTDRSREIAESYLDKFDGRLRIHTLTHNSGGASVPRNTAIRMARGKYITMVDSDDVLMPTMLEEMYNAAEEFDADFVYAEKHCLSNAGDRIEPNIPLTVRQMDSMNADGSGVTKPTLEPFSFAERIRRYNRGGYFGFVWGKLFHRDMFIENDLKFPQLKTSDDMTVVFYCVCLANKIVRTPTVSLIYRQNPTSLVHNNPTPEKVLHKAILNTAGGLKVICEFMDRLDAFKNQPELRHLVIDFFVQDHIRQGDIMEVYSKVPTHELNSILMKEFNAIDRGYHLELLSYLFNLANLNFRQNINQQLALKALQTRINRQ